MANELMLAQPVTAFIGGGQAAQQQQLGRQQLQSNQLAIRRQEEEAARESQFRNELGAYLQGGSNNLSALYAADPERAMQVQQFQIQQNQLARQQQIEQAKQSYASAQYVLASESPKTLAEMQFPQVVEQMKARGVDWDALTDDDVRGIAQNIVAQTGGLAGIAPPERFEDVEGPGDALIQRNVVTNEKRQVVAPQRPLVEINTGDKANAKGEEKLAELEAQQFSDHLQRGQAAQDKAQSLRALLSTSAQTGPTQDFRAAATSLFTDLGVPVSESRLNQVANLGQYKGVLNQLVLTEQLKQKGPQTESDAKRIAESFGKTSNIREANELILKYQLAMADREALLAEMAEGYREDIGKIDGWRKQQREYVRSTPLAGYNAETKRLVFWNEFQDAMREDNPDMTEDEIMAYWRKQYAR